MTPYQVSSEIYDGFFYSGITLKTSADWTMNLLFIVPIIWVIFINAASRSDLTGNIYFVACQWIFMIERRLKRRFLSVAVSSHMFRWTKRTPTPCMNLLAFSYHLRRLGRQKSIIIKLNLIELFYSKSLDTRCMHMVMLNLVLDAPLLLIFITSCPPCGFIEKAIKYISALYRVQCIFLEWWLLPLEN